MNRRIKLEIELDVSVEEPEDMESISNDTGLFHEQLIVESLAATVFSAVTDRVQHGDLAEAAGHDITSLVAVNVLKVSPRSPAEVSAKQAEQLGYPHYNNCPHLLVDVPDGGYTLACRTSEGYRVSVCFVPYRTGGPPQCVDIEQHHGDPAQQIPNGEYLLSVQDVRVFGPGPDRYAYRRDERSADRKESPTKVCLILHTIHEGD